MSAEPWWAVPSHWRRGRWVANAPLVTLGTVPDMTSESSSPTFVSDRFAAAFHERMLALFAERWWATLGRHGSDPEDRREALVSLRAELSELASGSQTLTLRELADRLVALHGVVSAFPSIGDAVDGRRWVNGAAENLSLWVEASLDDVVLWTEDSLAKWRTAIPDVLADVGAMIEDDPGEA